MTSSGATMCRAVVFPEREAPETTSRLRVCTLVWCQDSASCERTKLADDRAHASTTC